MTLTVPSGKIIIIESPENEVSNTLMSCLNLVTWIANVSFGVESSVAGG